MGLPLTLGAWTVQAADIVQTAEQDGRFNGFLHLLEAAGMAEMLENEGPFTVFAPIDEAFGQLPPGVLEWLLTEEGRTALEAIAQSHIVTSAALFGGGPFRSGCRGRNAWRWYARDRRHHRDHLNGPDRALCHGS